MMVDKFRAPNANNAFNEHLLGKSNLKMLDY